MTQAGSTRGVEGGRRGAIISAPRCTEDGAFTSFVRDTYRAMYYRARRLCKDGDAAFDVVQDTYIRMMRSCGNEVGKLNLGYAQEVLITAFVDHLRKEKRWQRSTIGEAERRQIDDFVRDPAQVVADYDRLMWLVRNSGLGEQQQKIALLTALQFKPKEIGELLGLAPGTVSNYLSAIKNGSKKRRRS